MSGAFKNAKKKLVQSEFRRLINEQKEKSLRDVKKIESPLARYNDAGQLTCVLCKTIVKSEAVWNVHLNAKLHRENVAAAKKLKERTSNFTEPLKRPLTPPMEVPTKRPKSILKNSKTTDPQVSTTESNIPIDFFDSAPRKEQSLPVLPVKSSAPVEAMEVEETTDELPEGFFDDPKMDAKARNQEYKDPVEEEWERFQREIREADSKSAAIIAEDQEEATNERQIEEIEEQMSKLSKVIDMEKKKESIVLVNNTTDADANEENSNDEDDDFDEYLDWRCKKAFG